MSFSIKYSLILGSSFLFLTTVNSSLFIFTLIGFSSSTVAFKIYFLLLPFSAVTIISKVFNPSLTSTSPIPVTLELESSN